MLATVYRIILRTQVSLGRIAFLALLASVGLVVGLAIGVGDVFDRLDAGTNLINAFGLSLYAPVATLVLASAALERPDRRRDHGVPLAAADGPVEDRPRRPAGHLDGHPAPRARADGGHGAC